MPQISPTRLRWRPLENWKHHFAYSLKKNKFWRNDRLRVLEHIINTAVESVDKLDSNKTIAWYTSKNRLFSSCIEKCYRVHSCFWRSAWLWLCAFVCFGLSSAWKARNKTFIYPWLVVCMFRLAVIVLIGPCKMTLRSAAGQSPKFLLLLSSFQALLLLAEAASNTYFHSWSVEKKKR